MEMQTLKDLYIEQLRDLYSAESQLIKALPKMAKAATNTELRDSLAAHLEQTKLQCEDVAKIIKDLGAKPQGHECQAMKGLIKEGQELLEKKATADPDVFDAGLIATAQRIEHYEIAGYGTVCTYAKTLGETEAAVILHRIAGEEGEVDQKLTRLAERVINRDAMQGAAD